MKKEIIWLKEWDVIKDWYIHRDWKRLDIDEITEVIN